MHILSVKYSENPVKLGNHHHDGHQILYVASGEVQITIDGEVYDVGPGSLVILSRFEEHSIQVRQGEYKRYTLRISSDQSAELSGDHLLYSVLVNRSFGFRHVIDVGEERERVERLLADMTREYACPGAMGEELLGSYLKQLFILLYRCAPDVFPSAVSSGARMIRDAQRRLEGAYGSSFSLASLASEYHVSVSYFTHLFKEVTGYAPIEYLMLCRLSAAKQYLCETDLPIKEIVDRCGFGDESNFSRTFKARTSVTPSAFRRQNRRHG